MKIKCRNLLFAATIILIASCNKSNIQGRYIPRQAAFVVQLNGQSLSAKLSWEEIKQNSFFKTVSNDSTLSTSIKLVLNNPDSTGIDNGADLIFFSSKDSLGGYIAFEGSIKNQDQFKSFNKQIINNGTATQSNGINFISKPALSMGYTKDKFIYVFNAPETADMDVLSKRMQRDSIDVPLLKARDVSTVCKALFALDEDASLAKNQKFSRLLKEGGDIHFWINGESLMTGVTGNPMMAMIDMEKFYKGTVTTAALSFDNGKISIDSKTYVSDEILKIYKKYAGGKVNEDMIKRMPGKDIIGLMAISFKPAVIKEILQMIGVDGMANVALKKVGFTLDDFIKGNKGDILIGVSDVSLKTNRVNKDSINDGDNMMENKPAFTYVFAASIADKDAFNKLINAGKKLGSQQLGDNIEAPFAYNTDGTYFTIANNKENTTKFLAGANSNVDFLNKINGESFGVYFNFQMFLKTFKNKISTDSTSKVVYDASVKLWDNATMKGGDLNSDDAITQSIEINLIDKSTNSLKQLNQYASKLSEVYKIRQDKDQAEMMSYEHAQSVYDSVKAVK